MGHVQERRRVADKHSYRAMKERIFLLSILLSLALHIFWLSAITVVAPKSAGPVKFSKVSFLGPILMRGAIDLRMEPRARSFLEERYFNIFNKRTAVRSVQMKEPYVLYVEHARANGDENAKLPGMVAETLAGHKLEPLDL